MTEKQLRDHADRMTAVLGAVEWACNAVRMAQSFEGKPASDLTTKELESLIGTLSNPSKMPGRATSTPARHCITGSKLREVEGSVCSDCYACKGMYGFSTVQAALDKRFAALVDLPRWTECMAELIGRRRKAINGYFRVHDSGDLQSVAHLRAWFEIAERHPDIQFWIPTKEARIYRKLRGQAPANLVVRVSAPMVGQIREDFVLTSSVGVPNRPDGGQCPAYKQDGECGSCRMCWSRFRFNINYPKH